ncbi:amino acid ABC transporter permease [Oleisolibacter albus]|uniref:amino acid ABC transporter permease n=1 Tax=Oleisolibacter albus TaxID=2171757 RepID=UPI0019612544|nr:amino acid ABC transporter permease [Oleisolibacter albus]
MTSMTPPQSGPRSTLLAPPRSRPLSLNDPGLRALLWQLLVGALVLLAGWTLLHNTLQNMGRLGIASGFGYLGRESGFAIEERMIEYGPTNTYARAYLVGLLNTLKVSALGIVLATLLGTLIGIGRLSGNWLVSRLCGAYVESLRNVPLLLQLFFWYAIITEGLPGPRQALTLLPDVFLSNRGLKLPAPADDPAWSWMAAAFALGIVVTLVLSAVSRGRQASTGRRLPMLPIGLGLILGLPLLVLLAFGGAGLDTPRLQGFNFTGGVTLTPEFAALLFGLVTYTAAFIAETVRSGILAVARGQTEAAHALGLSGGQTLRLVVLPQALRVIIPPVTSQFLNLTKNSSLAVAIGYPDFVSVANTTLNQTGQAVEGVAAIMIVYLSISLALSALLNWYNARIKLVER